MERYPYLILGGGMTAAAAAQAIHEVDPGSPIAMFSLEEHRPYKRPPLTKKLWQGKPESIVWLNLPEDQLIASLRRRVTRLDPQDKTITDETGTTYGYGKLLYAAGGSPRRLPFGGDDILYFRTLDDYHTLRSWTGQGARFGVIGGGFIGSEIAAALAMNGEQVVEVFPEPGIGARVYPADLSEFVTNYFREKGVDVRAGVELKGVERRGAKLVMQTSDRPIEVDHIIAGIGIRPNTELAGSADIHVGGPDAGGGVLVDEQLRTNQPGIYAAGDVASFYNPAQGRYMRVEHEDNANSMGRAAGLNMAGQQTIYDHQPYFYSDLFDLGYEAVGDLDSRLDTLSDWKEPFRKGVVYYLKDGRVRGVLLWNTWDQVDSARRLIASGTEVQKETLFGLIPEH